MFTFIQENLGSLLILLGVAVIVTLVIVSRLRAKKQGKSTCGCGCQACPMADACHRKENKK